VSGIWLLLLVLPPPPPRAAAASAIRSERINACTCACTVYENK